MKGAILILFIFGLLTYWGSVRKAIVAAGGGLKQISGAKPWFWVIVSLLAIATAWWLYTSHLTFMVLAEKAWGNLFFFVIVTAAITALLSWYPFTKERQWIARSWWVPGVLLGVLVLMHWANKPATQRPEDAVSFEPRVYVLTSDEVKIHGAPGDASSYGKYLCYSPEEGVETHRHVTSGGTYWTFRATNGDVVLRYQFLDTCPRAL